MEWRIGIHLGDVLVEGDDILGDGVNIAARLEGIAEPGGICISDDAFRQVRGKIEAEFADILRQRMHGPLREQAEWLKQVVNGYFQYHAVPTNARALVAFRYHVIDLWRRTLRRRGQKHRMTWQQIGTLADHWLPKPRILHPWPNQRFAVKHPRWEPYAGKPHVRFCAGGAQ